MHIKGLLCFLRSLLLIFIQILFDICFCLNMIIIYSSIWLYFLGAWDTWLLTESWYFIFSFLLYLFPSNGLGNLNYFGQKGFFYIEILVKFVDYLRIVVKNLIDVVDIEDKLCNFFFIKLFLVKLNNINILSMNKFTKLS